MSVYLQVQGVLKPFLIGWNSYQSTNLTFLIAAIIQRRSMALSELARSFPTTKRHCHRVKRLFRFLSNPRLSLSLLPKALARLSLPLSQAPGLWLPLVVDATNLAHFVLIMVAVPRNGSTLPVHWKLLRYPLAQDSQPLIEQALLKECFGLFAPSIKPIVVADRGFGRTSLFSWLTEQGKDFVIRVSGTVMIDHPEYQGLLAELPLPAKGRIFLKGVLYRQDMAVKVNLLAFWDEGHKEPWYLATSLSEPAFVEKLYRQRMRIEHLFRDLKL